MYLMKQKVSNVQEKNLFLTEIHSAFLIMALNIIANSWSFCFAYLLFYIHSACNS